MAWPGLETPKEAQRKICATDIIDFLIGLEMLSPGVELQIIIMKSFNAVFGHDWSKSCKRIKGFLTRGCLLKVERRTDRCANWKKDCLIGVCIPGWNCCLWIIVGRFSRIVNKDGSRKCGGRIIVNKDAMDGDKSAEEANIGVICGDSVIDRDKSVKESSSAFEGMLKMRVKIRSAATSQSSMLAKIRSLVTRKSSICRSSRLAMTVP